MLLGVVGFVCVLNDVSRQEQVAKPRNIRWAQDGLDFMKRQGLFSDILADVEDYGRPRPPSRYEIAVYCHGYASRLRTYSEELRQCSEEIVLLQPDSQKSVKDIARRVSILASIKRSDLPRIFGYLERGRVEFKSELRSLGIQDRYVQDSVGFFRRTMSFVGTPEPGSALRQFSDVPVGHWAAKATLELRSHGLVRGHPDGSFRG